MHQNKLHSDIGQMTADRRIACAALQLQGASWSWLKLVQALQLVTSELRTGAISVFIPIYTT
jgi:hypothetical protein